MLMEISTFAWRSRLRFGMFVLLAVYSLIRLHYHVLIYCNSNTNSYGISILCGGLRSPNVLAIVVIILRIKITAIFYSSENGCINEKDMNTTIAAFGRICKNTSVHITMNLNTHSIQSGNGDNGII